MAEMTQKQRAAFNAKCNLAVLHGVSKASIYNAKSGRTWSVSNG